MLKGGAGQDIFVFDTKLSKSSKVNKANLDKITDFTAKDDTIIWRSRCSRRWRRRA